MVLIGMFISNFRGGSGGLGEVFSSKLAQVDCKTDRKIDGELLEYGVKFPQKMAPIDLVQFRKLLINMSVVIFDPNFNFPDISSWLYGAFFT